MQEVNKHVPERLLSVCPMPEGSATTVRESLEKLVKTQKQLICANGKILAIGEILKAT